MILILILARLRLSSRRNGPDQGALLQDEATLNDNKKYHYYQHCYYDLYQSRNQKPEKIYPYLF